MSAVRVSATVRCATPAAYRELFNKLKFRRLLQSIHPADGGGYRIDIDGPMSLFSSGTKYGLALALILPAIRACFYDSETGVIDQNGKFNKNCQNAF